MKSTLEFLEVLETVIADRLAAGDSSSYTARLAAGGPLRVAQKVGEEGVELALATATGDRSAIRSEAADLVYHVMVLLQQQGLDLASVVAELESRHRG